MNNAFAYFLVFLILLPIIYPLTVVLINLIVRYNTAQRIKEISENSLEVTPEEILKQRGIAYGRRRTFSYANQYALTGVYILHNTLKEKYYVGQSVNVFNRVRQHFTGHGNRGVYADYLTGDKFMVKVIPLVKSGYTTLNSLERDTITAYNAYYKGYNGTRGNRG